MGTSVSSPTTSASICDAARRNLRGLLLGRVDGERQVRQRRVELPAQAHDSLGVPGPDRVDDRAAEFVVGRSPEPVSGVYVDVSWAWFEACNDCKQLLWEYLPAVPVCGPLVVGVGLGRCLKSDVVPTVDADVERVSVEDLAGDEPGGVDVGARAVDHD